ncbi:MAG: hypothetical protein CMJ27_12870 [Phycisphaerae bacterium]|nr:hypothetical protein [Phycisphaerae bacterium]
MTNRTRNLFRDFIGLTAVTGLALGIAGCGSEPAPPPAAHQPTPASAPAGRCEEEEEEE